MPWPPNKSEILAEVQALFDSDRWSLYKGEKVALLQREFAKAHDAEFGIATCNGTVPLEIVLTAMGIGPGCKVALPAYDFYSLPRSVTSGGAEPIFVDVDPTNLSIDCGELEKVIGSVRAVVAVHLSGSVAKLDTLHEMCRSKGVYLIEDCAQSTGAIYGGKHGGSWGDAGLFSFGGVKLMTSGQGGMIVTSNRDLADRCHAIANRGMDLDGKLNRFGIVGTNYQLSELAAAILLPQLRILPDLCREREQIMRRLDERISSLDGLSPFRQYPKTEIRSHFRYSFFVNGATKENGLRAKFLESASRLGIPLIAGHSAMRNDERLFSKYGTENNCPVAEEMQHRIVSIHHTDLLEKGYEFWENALFSAKART